MFAINITLWIKICCAVAVKFLSTIFLLFHIHKRSQYIFDHRRHQCLGDKSRQVQCYRERQSVTPFYSKEVVRQFSAGHQEASLLNVVSQWSGMKCPWEFSCKGLTSSQEMFCDSTGREKLQATVFLRTLSLAHLLNWVHNHAMQYMGFFPATPF